MAVVNELVSVQTDFYDVIKYFVCRTDSQHAHRLQLIRLSIFSTGVDVFPNTFLCLLRGSVDLCGECSFFLRLPIVLLLFYVVFDKLCLVKSLLLFSFLCFLCCSVFLNLLSTGS